MSTHGRDNLVEELNQATQKMGTRTVIFTHVIASYIGLSATEFECYDFIRQTGPVPAGRLAELTGLTTGAVTGVIDRLERSGFARRLPDPTDRRRVLVEAIDNQAARRKIGELYKPVLAGFYAVTASYTDADLAIITRYINESVGMIEDLTDAMAAGTRNTKPGH